MKKLIVLLFSVSLLNAKTGKDTSTPPPPTVTDAEQIQVLLLQRAELVAQNLAQQRRIERMDAMNRMVDEWNKRGCKIEVTEVGLLRCAEKKSDEK